MTATIPGKPQPKQRARKGKRGNWYTPTQTKKFERAVGLMAAFQRPAAWPMDARYRVELALYFPDRIHRDVDNVAKSVLDGANGILWDDDAQVDQLQIERHHDKANPRTELCVSIIGGDDNA